LRKHILVKVAWDQVQHSGLSRGEGGETCQEQALDKNHSESDELQNSRMSNGKEFIIDSFKFPAKVLDDLKIRNPSS